MRRRLIVACALAGSAAAAITLAGSAQGVALPKQLHHSDTTTPISGTFTSVVARNNMGAIAIVAGTTSKIRAVADWDVTKPTVTHSVSNGVLHVTAKCPTNQVAQLTNDCHIRIVITVPSHEAIDAASSFGDVGTSNLTGNEKLASDFGDVTANNLRASIVSATTNEGDVALDLLQAASRVTGQSDFGDVTVRTPSGAYRLNLSTDFGNVVTRGVTNSSSSSHAITASSNFGDITIQGT